MIPNYIHFIFFGFTEFTQIHYWSVKSAIAVHPNKLIFLHHTRAPKNNPLWDEITKLVELVYIDPPAELNGHALDSYQYKADVARLEILIKHGGIYMDIDVISLKPFGDLLKKSCVLGIENAQGTSISNAVIMAEPNHPFIIEWLKQTGDNLQNKSWAYHGVCLPKIILDSGEWAVHVEPRESFMPFDFHDEYIFGTTADDRLANSYTMHLWETIWWDKLKSLDRNSVLSQICRLHKKPLKIAIYTICKNEQHNVLEWAKTNGEADYRLVCDTGSTDDTATLLKEQGVTVIPITVIPWRFDMARGTSLNLLPDDIDVCIWQDLDERLLPGWRDQIQKHWTDETTTANHKYRNNSNPWQWHSKIHRRHGAHWQGAVHEELRWHIPEHSIWLPDLYLDEHQDVSKDRRGYFELLKKKVSEGDNHWRTYYFLANEYGGQGLPQHSIDTRIKSYEACDEGDMIQSYVAKHIAGGYDALDNRESAERWYKISVGHSNERESWFSYAEHAMRWQDWETAFLAARRCLECAEPRTGFTQDPRAWSEISYDIAALSAYKLGLYKKAIEWGEQAVSMCPTDERLKKNLEYYREAS
jgi:glycosyltransferase involved in cell wall biosynthesis